MFAGFRVIRPLLFALVALSVSAASFAAESIRVPGTRVSLEPPDEFQSASEFQGFERRELGASILVSEIPVPYATYRETFSREALERRSLFLEESGRWTVDGQDALLLRVSDASGGRAFEAWVLVFGNGQQSVLIFGSYPRDYAASLGPAVRRSVLSAQWDAAAEIGPFEGLPFEVEPTRELQLAGRMPDSVILTADGVAARAEPEDAFLVAGTAAGAVDFGTFESASREHLENSGLVTDIRDIRGRLASVDGLSGYELTAKALDAREGTPLVVYQLLLGEGQRRFHVMGFVGEGQAARYLPEFEAVAHSFRRRR